ncbi:UNVERIFIED_CONTAM: Proteasome adapter and scaffold protein ECM29 [Sesamum angustifolium]|uniref:Proteasome adapter and scaffold protein ECM29 n=1 Tax=Sesamum angustifolium TaxID=2727405 RepID=A0AAW2QTP0_9LAMI
MAESSNTSSAGGGGSWSAALSGKSDQEKEELLDRMLTRLALCDDSKLQDLLAKILPISIAALSSASSSLRNKVIEILSHVNKRVKHQLEISLPLSELWKLYVESTAAPMVRNFCIVYVEMAIDRVHKEEKQLMAPMFLTSISKLPPQHQDILLRITAKVIGECHASQVSDEALEKYRILVGSKGKIFLNFVSIQFCISHPLRGMLNVIGALELPSELVYPIYIAACSDSHEYVIKKGEELLKKNASGVNLDDLNLISRLFLLFNGTTGSDSIAPESKVNPGNLALRLRLMSIFCRSITAANSFPSTLQCIFGCIFGTDATSRLKQLGFILYACQTYAADAIARETRSFCFQAVGLLAQRMPQLFRDKIDVAVRLFDALKLEGQYIRMIVQKQQFYCD